MFTFSDFLALLMLLSQMAAWCGHQGDREKWGLGSISAGLSWASVCCWHGGLGGSAWASTPTCLYLFPPANMPCPHSPPALGNTYLFLPFGAVMVKLDLHGIEYIEWISLKSWWQYEFPILRILNISGSVPSLPPHCFQTYILPIHPQGQWFPSDYQHQQGEL